MTAHDPDMVRACKALERIAKVMEALGPIIAEAAGNLVIVGEILNPPPPAVPSPPTIKSWDDTPLVELNGVTPRKYQEVHGEDALFNRLYGVSAATDRKGWVKFEIPYCTCPWNGRYFRPGIPEHHLRDCPTQNVKADPDGS